MTPSRARPPPFVRLFQREAAPVFADSMRPDRCLNATRVCMLVMAEFNVRVFPMSVQAIAMNAVFRRKLLAAGRLPTARELPAWVEDGAWSVGVDTNPSSTDEARNAWAGHLVAIAQDWIVDAAAGQMSRPMRGIRVPDILVGPTTPKFLKGKGGMCAEADDGECVTYTPRLDDTSFWDMPGFQPHEHNRAVAHTIVLRIEAATGQKRRPCARP